jgi:PIN domain nuclease of toxin-antitoxin system
VKYLTDTQIFLWYLAGDSRILPKARNFLGDTVSNTFFLSDVTAWEASIKYGLGKLHLPETPETFFSDRVRQADYRHLRIDLRHVTNVHSLPPAHKDPFDRLLVSQAALENMTLISDDPVFKHYGVKLLTLLDIS